MSLKAPFPWFGGKSRVAHVVWDYFGDVPNYVDPFAGSLATLLLRPHEPRCETVNDKDCYLANFWRALAGDPEAVAHWADWPVNEVDLHARHAWLTGRLEFRQRMQADPDHFDAKVAGWWVWGISQWIGSGWCSRPEWQGRALAGRAARGIHAMGDRQAPNEKGQIQSEKFPDEEAGPLWQSRPRLTSGGQGVHGKRPMLRRGGAGVNRVARHHSGMAEDQGTKLPSLRGQDGAFGHGVHRSGMTESLIEYFRALANRLRRVRVCCGDWKRVLGPTPTTIIGVTGVLLDPPYSDLAGRNSRLYAEDSESVAHEVREWALAHGGDPLFRIALCGYEGEHEMPGWSCVAWKTQGGYGNQAKAGKGRENAGRERIWFSPHCLKPEADLFAHFRQDEQDLQDGEVKE